MKNEQTDLGFVTTSANGLDGMTSTEKLELMQKIAKADLAVYFAGLPMVKSSDIIGVRVNILDAMQTELTDNGEVKDVVTFLCENAETGDLFTTTKGANKFNLTFVERFDARRGVAEQPLFDYVFINAPEWGQRGNDAIILRQYQAPKEEKPVTKK